LCGEYSVPCEAQSDNGDLDDLELLAPRVDERPAAHRQSEHRRGVPEVQVRDDREVISPCVIQDDLVKPLTLL
jgi:hypothetical protein